LAAPADRAAAAAEFHDAMAAAASGEEVGPAARRMIPIPLGAAAAHALLEIDIPAALVRWPVVVWEWLFGEGGWVGGWVGG
jgi:hypothetical protein